MMAAYFRHDIHYSRWKPAFTCSQRETKHKRLFDIKIPKSIAQITSVEFTYGMIGQKQITFPVVYFYLPFSHSISYIFYFFVSYLLPTSL